MAQKKFPEVYTLLSIRFYELHDTRFETYTGDRGNATMKQLKIAITKPLLCKNNCKNVEQSAVFFF